MQQQRNERQELIVRELSEIASALGPAVPDDRIIFYADALDDLTIPQLKHGFEIARRNLGEFLPSVRELREWCEKYRPAEPVPVQQRPDFEEVRNTKISASEIVEWLNAGKQAQREHIAKLQADPKWQEMRKRLGGEPGLPRRK